MPVRRARALRRWRLNHAAAIAATRSSAPGSSNRCVASGTTSKAVRRRSCARASRFSSSTTSSRAPTISRVGARTSASRGAGRGVFELVAQPLLQQVDRLVELPRGHLSPDRPAVHVEHGLGDRRPRHARIRRAAQLHPREQHGPEASLATRATFCLA